MRAIPASGGPWGERIAGLAWGVPQNTFISASPADGARTETGKTGLILLISTPWMSGHGLGGGV
jgi:hypothetical protein